MKILPAIAGLLLLGLCAATTPVQASAAGIPKDSLLFIRESGGNSFDIQGTGTNRSAYGLSWNVYDRLVTYGRSILPAR